MTYDKEFWAAVDALIASSVIHIDRPKGSRHPRYPDCVYKFDYGYLTNTESMDGGGIDVWRGSLDKARCDAIICTVDLFKRDSEIKLLIGCADEEKTAIYEGANESEMMKGIIIHRGS
jgi:Inorganic pyrophosphatase